MNRRDKLNEIYKKNLSHNIDDLWFFYNKKFLGCLIKKGLKQKAINRMCKILYALKKNTHIQGRDVFLASMLKLTPEVAIKYFRRGSTKQPYVKPLMINQKIGIAIRWVVKTAREKEKKNNPRLSKLISILMDSLINKGDAIKQKRLVYNLASANRHIRPPYIKNKNRKK